MQYLSKISIQQGLEKDKSHDFTTDADHDFHHGALGCLENSKESIGGYASNLALSKIAPSSLSAFIVYVT